MFLLHIQSDCSKTLHAKMSYTLYSPLPIHNFFALWLVTKTPNAINVLFETELVFYMASLRGSFEINNRIRFEVQVP
jgi:hypothetical protein